MVRHWLAHSISWRWRRRRRRAWRLATKLLGLRPIGRGAFKCGTCLCFGQCHHRTRHFCHHGLLVFCWELRCQTYWRYRQFHEERVISVAFGKKNRICAFCTSPVFYLAGMRHYLGQWIINVLYQYTLAKFLAQAQCQSPVARRPCRCSSRCQQAVPCPSCCCRPS